MSTSQTAAGRALRIRAFDERDRARVVDLWQRCGLMVPWNDPDRDIDLKLAFQPEGLLVATQDGVVVGTVMAGYEGHRGWINYLAVEPELRTAGLGRRLMDAAEAWLRALGCPKINLQVRSSNLDVLEFYRKLGYVESETVSLGKSLD